MELKGLGGQFRVPGRGIGCIQGGTATGETDTMLAFLNTPTFPVFSPPTYFNPALSFGFTFLLSFILLLSTVFFFYIPRNAYRHLQ